jgi:hypothetical protein
MLLVMAILTTLPVAAAKRELTVKSAVCINDTQIVIEFSEPIAINKIKYNRGPYVALRMLKSDGGVQSITNIKSVYYGSPIQWSGKIEYVDSNRDRLLWTINEGRLGLTTIPEILSLKGELAEYEKCKLALVIEEVPYDETQVFTDNAICNITTRDGEVHLTPTLPSSWEKCIIPITVNYGYRVDVSQTLPTKEPIIYDRSLIGEGIVSNEDVPEPAPEPPLPTRVLQNDPIVLAAILGGGVLAGVILMLILIVPKKKKAKPDA